MPAPERGRDTPIPQLTLIGTGEAFDPDLPNTSLLYRGAATLLVDCGYSVPGAFWQRLRDPDSLDGIYLSHRHADHSFGLPGLLYWMKFAGRTRPLTLLGGPELEPWVSELLDFAYPGSWGEDFFPLEKLPLTPGRPVVWRGVALSTALSEHGTVNSALSMGEGEARVCYSGDGAPTEETRALYRGAGLLVHECFAPSDPPRGHAGLTALVAMAEELEIERLALVHVGCENKSAVRQLASETRARCRIVVPEPGEVLEL